MNDQHMSRLLYICISLSILLAGCAGQSGLAATPAPLASATPSPISTQTIVPPTLTATVTPLPTATMLPTSTPEPLGCQQPPDDYTRVEINGWTINQRTLAMLAHAW